MKLKIKNKVLANKVRVADNPITRLVGLLADRDIEPDEAMIIKPCNSIHTCFMRFAIDVIFVNKNSEVIRVFKNVVPFRVLPIIFKANYVIEMKSGFADVQKGDIIQIDE